MRYVFGSKPGRFQRAAGGDCPRVGAAFVIREHMPVPDAGSGDDPFIAGVDKTFQIGVGKATGGNIRAKTLDAEM